MLCVLDAFDYSLEEIAELVDCTVGGMKAALNRGRSKSSYAVPGKEPTNSGPRPLDFGRIGPIFEVRVRIPSLTSSSRFT
jgi:hypothetical protein